jgi:hypothetical protein
MQTKKTSRYENNYISAGKNEGEKSLFESFGQGCQIFLCMHNTPKMRKSYQMSQKSTK